MLLLAVYVSHQVQNTEGVASAGGEGAAVYTSGEPSAERADSADPQSIGALARAMRTQCAQLVGHTLVLLRNLVEALQRALKERSVLPGVWKTFVYKRRAWSERNSRY